jgi:hypothetical protein
VKTGLIAALIMAIPSVDLTLYTTISLGGYGEALLLGNLTLLMAISLARMMTPPLDSGKEWIKPIDSNRRYQRIFSIKSICLGFLVGLGLWANGLTLVFSIPSLVYLVLALQKQKTGARTRSILHCLVAMLIGFCAGATPLEIYLIGSGPTQLVREYFGSAVAVETGTWLLQAASHLVNFMLLGVPALLSFRPPWGVTWLVLPLIPVLSLLWAWIIISIIKEIEQRKEGWREILLLFGVMEVVLIGFIATPFGVDPSGRYFLPLAAPLAIFAAHKIETTQLFPGKWRTGLLILIVGFNMVGTVQSALVAPQSFTTQFDSTTIIDHRFDSQLISFLEQNDEHYGYGNYWTAYPIDFLSAEKIILIPRLPYHQDFRYTSRDDRYPLYDTMVSESQKVFYVTARFEALDEQLRGAFTKNGITWKEATIGDYRVFYHLSKPLRPRDINLDYGS